MASTFTANIQIEEPGRGDQVNTWSSASNNNSTLLDLVGGGTAAVSLAGAPVTLSAAQFRSKTITFNSTLTASCIITFPTSFTKTYEIQNLCTGSSAFVVTLTTTASGGQAICCPPGEIIDVINDGANIRFKSLGHVGDYWDHAGSSVPAWVSNCTVPPYLNCDGTTFASSTYPALALVLGGTTVADSRGRTRYALNQATARVTSAISGVDGNTRGAAGGSESMQQHSHAITDPGHTHGHNLNQNNSGTFASAPPSINMVATGAATINAAVTGITINNSSAAGASQNMPPAYIAGITMIRAA